MEIIIVIINNIHITEADRRCAMIHWGTPPAENVGRLTIRSTGAGYTKLIMAALAKGFQIFHDDCARRIRRPNYLSKYMPYFDAPVVLNWIAFTSGSFK